MSLEAAARVELAAGVFMPAFYLGGILAAGGSIDATSLLAWFPIAVSWLLALGLLFLILDGALTVASLRVAWVDASPWRTAALHGLCWFVVGPRLISPASGASLGAFGLWMAAGASVVGFIAWRVSHQRPA